MPGLGAADALHVSLDEIRRTLDGVESGLAGIRAGRRWRPGPRAEQPQSRAQWPPQTHPASEAPFDAPFDDIGDESEGVPESSRRPSPQPQPQPPASASAVVAPTSLRLAPSEGSRRQTQAPVHTAVAHATVGRHRQPPARRLLAVAAGLLLVGLGLVAVNLVGRREFGSTDRIGLQGAQTLPSAVAPAVGSVAARASTAAERPPLFWPGGAGDAPSQLVGRGPGVDAPGTDVVVAPGGGGSVEVYERVDVASPDPAGLRLALPDLSSVSNLTVGANLVVTELQVTADGRPVTVDPAEGRWLIQGADGAPVKQAVLRYRLAGALVQHEQSLPRRALLLVAPLSAAASRAGGSEVVVHADRVLVRDMTCPLASAAQVLCGSGGRPTWVARVPASSAIPLVLLQVDLPG